MITDPAEVRRLLGWTDDKIAALKAAPTWPQRVDLLLALIQPHALRSREAYWLQQTEADQMARYLAKQSRSGLEQSLFFTVPAGAAEMRVAMDADGGGFSLPNQGVTAKVILAMDAGMNNLQGGGETVVYGAANRVNKQNQPIPDSAIPLITAQLLAESYPVKAAIETFTAGELTYGLDVTYFDANGVEL